MNQPVYLGGLELRDAGDGSRRLNASFPYKSKAVIHSGGKGQRPRKEQFAPKAFEFAIEEPDRDIHLLVGHDFGKPLASKNARTLLFQETLEALKIEAIITAEIQESSWWKDFLAAFMAGLIGGISPGFRVAPPEAVENAEETTEEDPAEGNALIRTIFAAILFEFSLVTRPAYPETALDLRQFQWDRNPKGLIYPLNRWRV